MMALFQTTNLPAAETLLMSIPESAGLLVFGVAVTAVAVGIRAILARRDTGKRKVAQARRLSKGETCGLDDIALAYARACAN